MAIFRRRLPPRRDIVLGFAVCAFPIFSWSILLFFRKIPYWALFLSVWDLISALAYTLLFALLESVTILLLWILVSAVLPARFLLRRFVALGSIVVLVSAGWVIVDHLHPFFSLSLPARRLLYVASIGMSYLVVYRSPKLEKAIYTFAERLTVLLYVYIPAALLGAGIVILRNLGAS